MLLLPVRLQRMEHNLAIPNVMNCQKNCLLKFSALSLFLPPHFLMNIVFKPHFFVLNVLICHWSFFTVFFLHFFHLYIFFSCYAFFTQRRAMFSFHSNVFCKIFFLKKNKINFNSKFTSNFRNSCYRFFKIVLFFNFFN